MTEAIAPSSDLGDELCRLKPADRLLRLKTEGQPEALVIGLADTVSTLAAARGVVSAAASPAICSRARGSSSGCCWGRR